MNIARSPADSLDEGTVGAQESLFIGVKYSDQGNFWQIESFAQAD